MRDFNSFSEELVYGFIEIASEVDSQGLVKVETIEDGTGDQVDTYLNRKNATKIINHLNKVFNL